MTLVNFQNLPPPPPPPPGGAYLSYLALITAFTTMITESQTYNRVITINTIYDMHDYDMMNMLKGWKEEGVVSSSVVLNVRNKAGVTAILH